MTERRVKHFGKWRTAIRQMIDELGGAESFSKLMWPKRDPQRGARLINDWLNVKRRDKPDFEEIEQMLWIGRVRGVHVAFHDLSDRLNYSRANPVDPKEKLSAIAEIIQQQKRALDESIANYKRLKFDFDLMNDDASSSFTP